MGGPVVPTGGKVLAGIPGMVCCNPMDGNDCGNPIDGMDCGDTNDGLGPKEDKDVLACISIPGKLGGDMPGGDMPGKVCGMLGMPINMFGVICICGIAAAGGRTAAGGGLKASPGAPLNPGVGGIAPGTL